MKKRYIPVLALAFLLLAFSACKQKTTGGIRKDRSAGATLEILVVTQNDDQWKGMIGDTIRSFFLQEQYGLPQPEDMNKLAHINVKGFNDMFKKHKCLLIVEIDPKLTKPVVETGEDVWASPQRMIKISAPDRASWCQKFEEQKEAYKRLFDKVERERMISILRPSKEDEVAKRIREKMGFEMVIPSGFFIMREEPDFMWICKETDVNSNCFFIYTTPYRDTVQLDYDHLIAVRDRMLKNYVPGPVSGYMTTDKEYMPPIVNYVSDFPTGFAAEMRGMWCLEDSKGDHMGGPFISYTFPDNRTGQLVTVEGYVYYPNQDKRDLLLQLQSLIFSIKMPDTP